MGLESWSLNTQELDTESQDPSNPSNGPQSLEDICHDKYNSRTDEATWTCSHKSYDFERRDTQHQCHHSIDPETAVLKDPFQICYSSIGRLNEW